MTRPPFAVQRWTWSWAAWAARLDPSRPEGRRFALRFLLAIAACSTGLYWALDAVGLASEGEGQEFALAGIVLFALAVSARGPTLRPLGFAALCAIPTLPLLFTLAHWVRRWMA